MTRLRFIGWLSLAMVAGAGLSRAQEPSGLREVRFHESGTAPANPERGFYAPRMSQRMNGLEGLRERGITLLLVEMDLRDFKDREIGPEKLDELRSAFGEARKHGLKVIFRAAYGFTGRDYRADPKDLARIRGHIEQLGAVFGSERDVLFAVQAGLLGPWGEWHGSNHGDPPSLEARREVLFGLLRAVPSPIPVLVRRPMFVRDLFADQPGGSGLTPEAAREGSPLSRTGWHDDALLALPLDMGTYAEEGWDRARELRWSENHNLHAPFGGETVPLSAKMPVEQVVRELEQLRTTYLNSAYHRGTLNRWRQEDYRGEKAYNLIERRLGYRLVADRLRYTPSAFPGGVVEVEIELSNVGFAPPHAPREVSLVLSLGGTSHRVTPPGVDTRRWLPGSTIRLAGTIRIPPDAPAGLGKLSLHLADPSPRLRGDSRYAIRLANEGIRFDEASGENVLVEDVEIRQGRPAPSK